MKLTRRGLLKMLVVVPLVAESVLLRFPEGISMRYVAHGNAKIGDTIQIKKPMRFSVSALISDAYVPLTLATPEEVAAYREKHNRIRMC